MVKRRDFIVPTPAWERHLLRNAGPSDRLPRWSVGAVNESYFIRFRNDFRTEQAWREQRLHLKRPAGRVCCFRLRVLLVLALDFFHP